MEKEKSRINEKARNNKTIDPGKAGLNRTPEMPKPQIKCDVCGYMFEPTIDMHYIARSDEQTGLAAAISNTEPSMYDAFDCPYCGCQHIAAKRLRRHTEEAGLAYEYEKGQKAECLGGECNSGKTECCRDCEDRTSCWEVCDGYEGAGCDGECESRCERRED